MPSHSRELTLLGLLSATLWLPQCSLLTKVDWSIIPPPGGASSGGASASAGEAGEAPAAAGERGVGAEGGMAGESGAGGDAGDSEGGFGGSLGGGGGAPGKGGSGGGAGKGGDDGTGGAGAGAPGHTTCSTAPTPPAVLPDVSQFIVLFDGGPGANGARGGRVGLDAECSKAKLKLGLTHTDTRAVISVEAPIGDLKPDQIINMVDNYGIPGDAPAVVSPINQPFAPSWRELWKNMGALPSLVCAGVMPESTTRWLTGSNGRSAALETNGIAYFGLLDASVDLAGMQFANACNGWELGTASPATKAHVGSTTADHDPGSDGHPRFIDFLNVECSSADDNILCVAFNKAP